jgi:hypothetical protein
MIPGEPARVKALIAQLMREAQSASGEERIRLMHKAHRMHQAQRLRGKAAG